MQLLILILLLAFGGKSQELNEVKPLIESLGDEEVQKAFKSAEELSSLLSIVQGVAGGNAPVQPQEPIGNVDSSQPSATVTNADKSQHNEPIGNAAPPKPNEATGNAFRSQPKEPITNAYQTQSNEPINPVAFPLSPIVNIADEPITYSLSRYLATGN